MADKGDKESDAIQVSEYYAYIHILPEKTGDQAVRNIVPINSIKKFDVTAYKNSAKIRTEYRTTQFKFRLGPGEKKQKCFVLYVGDSFETVQQTSISKRFSAPTFGTSMTNDTSTDSIDLQIDEELDAEIVTNKKRKRKDKSNKTIKDIEEQVPVVNELEDDSQVDMSYIKNAKKQRKALSKIKKNNKSALNQSVLDNYLQNAQHENEDPIIEACSTPLRNSYDTNQKDKIIHDQSIKIKQLEYQLSAARTEARKRSTNEECNLQGSDECSEESQYNNVSTLSKKEIDPFCVHDKIYGFTKEKLNQEMQYDSEGNVHIGHGVYCNAIAYNDSFKTKSPYKCLSLLSEGVYGLEDLSTRCVRKQKNTRQKRELSPIKKMAIERQVYCFMRVKDKTISQIDDFLNDLNKHHHKVVSGAMIRHQNAKIVREMEVAERLEEEEAERIRLQEEEAERIRLQEEEAERIRLQEEEVERMGLHNQEI